MVDLADRVDVAVPNIGNTLSVAGETDATLYTYEMTDSIFPAPE